MRSSELLSETTRMGMCQNRGTPHMNTHVVAFGVPLPVLVCKKQIQTRTHMHFRSGRLSP